MSTLKVNAIRQTAASSDAVTLAADGTCTVKATNNLSNKNLIINGAMTINQRGHSGAITDGSYSLDRYRLNITSAGAWSVTQADLGTAGPAGFRNSLKLDCDTANSSLSAGSMLQLHQKIEAQDLQQLAYGSSGAKSVTISFWIKSNKTGTFPLELYCTDPGTNRQYIKLYTISSADTWEKKTLTFAGDTGGQINDDNGTGMVLNWYLAAGTDFTSGSNDPQWVNQDNTERAAGITVNLADSTSNYAEFTGIQLEVGDVATDFEHRSYGDELARCQRYFYSILNSGWVARGEQGSYVSMGTYLGNSKMSAFLYHPVPMRANPTLEIGTGTNYWGIYRAGAEDTFDSLGSIITNTAAPFGNMFTLLETQSGVSSTGGYTGVISAKDTGAYLRFTAEL